MAKPKKDSIEELVKAGRIRNRFLAAATLKTEIRSAAQRVLRLSEPGTAKRFFTLTEVAEDSGLPRSKIVRELGRLRSENRRLKQKPS